MIIVLQAYSPEFVNDVISQSDYLVLSMPLTPQTKHFIKAENLIHAKKDMILINVGRGELIEDDALIAALKTGIIKGAALDVFSVEPLPVESEYWSLPNVLLSPHNADLLIDSRHKSIRFFTENCKNFLAGEDLMCIVNKKLGY